jgi:hypothetical protein
MSKRLKAGLQENIQISLDVQKINSVAHPMTFMDRKIFRVYGRDLGSLLGEIKIISWSGGLAGAMKIKSRALFGNWVLCGEKKYPGRVLHQSF